MLEVFNRSEMDTPMKEFGEFESETFIADKLILFKSELNPSGSIYSLSSL